MRLVLLGAPGSGKGTQAERVVKQFQIPHISTGNMLRQAVASQNELGRLADSFLKEGKLVPDYIIIRIIEERLGKPDCVPGYVLDGFPRTVAQAKSLESSRDSANQSLDAVVYLQVAEATLLNRLVNRRVCSKCQAVYHLFNHPPKEVGICNNCGGPLVQRPDDEEITVKQRLKVYEEQTVPLLDFYQKLGLLVVLDGEKEPALIFDALVDAIKMKIL
ncbi:MAG: adenylate kinase [bacterium]|nr:adenylate kinase [bacterium]